jgi:hypothetical protein
MRDHKCDEKSKRGRPPTGQGMSTFEPERPEALPEPERRSLVTKLVTKLTGIQGAGRPSAIRP